MPVVKIVVVQQRRLYQGFKVAFYFIFDNVCITGSRDVYAVIERRNVGVRDMLFHAEVSFGQTYFVIQFVEKRIIDNYLCVFFHFMNAENASYVL